MNLELRKRKDRKVVKLNYKINQFYFNFVLRIIYTATFPNSVYHSCTSGDQTTTFGGPGQFYIATGNRATPSFSPASTWKIYLKMVEKKIRSWIMAGSVDKPGWGHLGKLIMEERGLCTSILEKGKKVAYRFLMGLLI